MPPDGLTVSTAAATVSPVADREVPQDVPGGPAGADGDDRAAVAELLGREPNGRFDVVVRSAAGVPVVIRNHPLMDDGRPMPTRYWLVDRELNRRIGTLEAEGGVRRSEAEVDPDELAAAHERYAAERDALVPADWEGPRPYGGVGGTRRGVKCLHTHYAWFLAGGDDPIGRWVDEHLDPAVALPSVAAPLSGAAPTADPVAAPAPGTNEPRRAGVPGARPLGAPE